MRIPLRKAVKWLLACGVAVVILIALTFAAFGVVVSRVPEYRSRANDAVRAYFESQQQ